jgi:hypothetical protein
VVTQQAAHHQSPLSWFGVMVSPDLRTAQADFSGALQAACELAKAQRQVLSLHASFVEQSKAATAHAEQTASC